MGYSNVLRWALLDLRVQLFQRHGAQRVDRFPFQP